MRPRSPIGFVQGRLSPPVNGLIQSFPTATWESEFELAAEHGFCIMEWTLDFHDLHANPLMSRVGRESIRKLSEQHGLRIPSLTGDCFMQHPFWKSDAVRRPQLEQIFKEIVFACGEAGIGLIVLPLVDNGAIEDDQQESLVTDFLCDNAALFVDRGVSICIESDYPPERLLGLILSLPVDSCGINYDIGNSASAGFDPLHEVRLYGDRILNVHVKDRLLGGTTVPLGMGDADIPGALAALRAAEYRGNFILQAARADDGDDAGALCRYRDITIEMLLESSNA
jgi:L-ribulose-5-phosphate 3-epimerase